MDYDVPSPQVVRLGPGDESDWAQQDEEEPVAEDLAEPGVLAATDFRPFDRDVPLDADVAERCREAVRAAGIGVG